MTPFVDRLLIHVITYLLADFTARVVLSTDMTIWAIGFVAQICVKLQDFMDVVSIGGPSSAIRFVVSENYYVYRGSL